MAVNDSIHAPQTPEASPTASPDAMTARANPHGDVAMAPASAAPETTSSPSAVSDGYGIDEDIFYTAQLASFRTADRARAGWKILKDSAGELLAQSDAHIVRADLGSELGIYYRVRTGAMIDRAAANQFCQDLQAEGLDCMPVEASLQETNETLVEKICETGSNGALCGTAQRSNTEPQRPPHFRG